MWLTDCWIHGLRRFGGNDEHRVRIDAKMVCLIGANEAGKSTVLDALEFARQAEAIPPAARSRGESVVDDRTIVRLQYRVDDADRAALASIVRDADGPQEVQWFTVEKQAGAGYNYYALPELIRDRAPRRSLHTKLVEHVRVWWPRTPPGGPATNTKPTMSIPTPSVLSRQTRAVCAK